MIHAENDLSFMLINRRGIGLGLLSSIYLSFKWKAIYEQYIEKFGFGDKYIEVLHQKIKIALLMIQKALSDDQSQQTFIEIAQLELEKLLKDTGNNDFYEMKAMMEKQLGFPIDEHKTSVAQFYSYLSVINKLTQRRADKKEFED